MTDLDKLDALAAAHDFRHWHVDMNAPNHLILEDGSGKLLAKCFDTGQGWTADAIQQAVRAIPELTATIRDLVAAARERDELRAAAEADANAHPCFNESCRDRKALRAALHHKDGAS